VWRGDGVAVLSSSAAGETRRRRGVDMAWSCRHHRRPGRRGELFPRISRYVIWFLVPYESASTSASHARDIAAGVASHEQHIYASCGRGTRHAWMHARTGFFAACIQFEGDTVPVAQLASKTAHSFPGIGFFDA
jgi:hypothetical protein